MEITIENCLDIVNNAKDFLQEHSRYHNRESKKKSTSSPNASKKHNDSFTSSDMAMKLIDWQYLQLQQAQEENKQLKNRIKEIETERVESNSIPESIDESLFSFEPLSLNELPPEIVGALNLSKSDTLEVQIIELLKIAKRPLNANELIIGLYRKYQVITEEKNQLSSKLYRMSQSKQIESAEGRGNYQLPTKETHPTLSKGSS